MICLPSLEALYCREFRIKQLFQIVPLEVTNFIFLHALKVDASNDGEKYIESIYDLM